MAPNLYLRCTRCKHYIAGYKRDGRGTLRRQFWLPVCACGPTGRGMSFDKAIALVAEGRFDLEEQLEIPGLWTPEELAACERVLDGLAQARREQRARLRLLSTWEKYRGPEPARTPDEWEREMVAFHDRENPDSDEFEWR